MNVAADLPAYGGRTALQLQGIGTDAAPGIQEVSDRELFRLDEKPVGDYCQPLPRNRNELLDVAGLQNNHVAMPPSAAGATTDADPAGLRTVHSLFHQLIIASPCSIFGKDAPQLSWSLYLPIVTPEGSGVATTTGRQARETAQFAAMALGSRRRAPACMQHSQSHFS